MTYFHVISISLISGGDHVVLTTFCGYYPCVHYFCGFTVGNDVAKDMHCDVTMGNDLAMCTYHGITMHSDVTMNLFWYYYAKLFH